MDMFHTLFSIIACMGWFSGTPSAPPYPTLKKMSWRLGFGLWVLYFHRMLNSTYWVLEVDWPLTLNVKNRWSRDLGNLLPASNGNNGNLQNC